MGSFFCCIWWFIAGILLGWLLNWLLSKFLGNNNDCCENNDDHRGYKQGPRDINSNNLVGDTNIKANSEATVNGFVENNNIDNGRVDVKSSLMSTAPAIDLALAKLSGFKLSGVNDLTVIEGIGPKISELFNKNGHETFAQLADLNIEQMKEVLKSGGDKFTLARPDTWGEQAALARDNRWSELKALQDVLVGGIRPENI